MSAIPEDFIKQQIDMLLEIASGMPDGPFRDAVLRRADHYMDLVKEWRTAEGVKCICEHRAAESADDAREGK